MYNVSYRLLMPIYLFLLVTAGFFSDKDMMITWFPHVSTTPWPKVKAFGGMP